nr:hypothetical protein BGP89_10515 [Luteimonas sp. JM171]
MADSLRPAIAPRTGFTRRPQAGDGHKDEDDDKDASCQQEPARAVAAQGRGRFGRRRPAVLHVGEDPA